MPRLVGLVVGDEPDAWRAAGFAVDADGGCRIGDVTITLAGRDEGRGVRAWSFATTGGNGIDGDDLDGARLVDPPRAGGGDAPGHPNGVVAIDHLVLLTPDHPRTTAALEAVGLELRRVRETDQYGFPAEQRFFRSGEVILEVIGAATPEPGDERPVAFFGLAHTVDDLDTTVELLGEHLGRVKDAVQPGRRIVTLRHKELHLSVPTAFMSPEPDAG